MKSLSNAWGKEFNNQISKISSSTQTMKSNLKIDRATGTTSTTGTSEIVIGNNIASGTDGNTRGYVTLYGTSAYYGRIQAGALTASRTFTLPDKTGTIATTDDVATKVTKAGDTMTGNLTVNRSDGTTSAVGASYLIAGNSTASGTDKNSRGILRLYGTGANYAHIVAGALTANRTFTLPDAGGTIATTTNVDTKISKAGDTFTGTLLPSTDGTLNLGSDTNRMHYLYARRLVAVESIASGLTYNSNQVLMPGKSGTMALISDIPEYIVERVFSLCTMNKNSTFQGTRDVTKSGYSAMGIIGTNISNASSSGAENYMLFSRYAVSSNSLSYTIRHLDTSGSTSSFACTLGFDVLYKKN